MTEITAQDILTFWFEEATPQQWFSKDDGFDARIKERYADLLDALSREIDEKGQIRWEDEPLGALAGVLVLDQFPRNIHRGTAKAFAYDEKARGISQRLIDRSGDEGLTSKQRQFLYLPFMHVEDLAAQEFCVTCFETRLEDQSDLSFAIDHRDIIKRFGRFPHRNAILGRQSTEEELQFLADGGFAG